MIGGRVPGTPSGAIPRAPQVEADGRGAGIERRVHLVLLGPVGHTHPQGEPIGEAIGRAHGVDLDMACKVHHTAAKRGRAFRQTKGGLCKP